MSDIHVLADLLRTSTDLDLTLDCPERPGAPCWLDVEAHGRFVAVEWRPGRGFGISLVDASEDPRTGLFEGPDEVVTNVYAARDRVLELLGSERRMSLRRAASR